MKSALSVLVGLTLATTLFAADDGPFKSTKEKTSYALGQNIGTQLRQNNAEIDVDMYLRGLKEAIAGGKTLLTDEQVRETLTAFQMELKNKTLEKGRKEGEAFLAENKSKPGVVITPSGLQYKIETKGTGKLPGTNDTVVCHYRGTLVNGTEFDSSYKRGEPSSFGVTGVIKGWTEALLMMPVGSKWKLTIPSELAYGERGRPSIPPNSVLLFDIELVSIKDPTEGAAVSKPVQVQPQVIPVPAPAPKAK